MDILDRLLGHDEWTTRQVLLRCCELTSGQMQQSFDVGHTTIEDTLRHMIGNIEVWTDLMCERPVRKSAADTPMSLDELSRRFDTAYVDFAAFARQVTDQERLDQT